MKGYSRSEKRKRLAWIENVLLQGAQPRPLQDTTATA